MNRRIVLSAAASAAIGVLIGLLLATVVNSDPEPQVYLASGTVFADLDEDGELDDDEPGLAGVTMRVTGPNGDSLPFLTSPNGTFEIEMTVPRFTIEVTEARLPDGAVSTTGVAGYELDVSAGPETDIDFGYRGIQVGTSDFSDADAFEGSPGALPTSGAMGSPTEIVAEPAVTRNSGSTAVLAAFAYQATATVIGVVFDDENGNGQQDEGEPGLGNVVVVAIEEDTGAPITATTGTDGRYTISADVINHRVRVDESSLPFNGQLTSDWAEYNLNVPPGFTAPNINFGYEEVEPAVASGFVFDDANGNGIQDEGEVGLSGVTLNITHDETGVLTTLTTNPDGSYRFEPNGVINHQITVDTATLPFNGQLTTGRESYNLNISPGFTAPFINFGYQEIQPSAVSGTVFEDINGNGERDDGEPGLAGVTITATHHDGTTTTVSTGPDGTYLYESTISTRFAIAVDESTLPFTAGLLTTGRAGYTLNIPAGFIAPNVNFGYRDSDRTAFGTVFDDANANGEQDDGEAGLAGVTVVLTSFDDSMIEAVTDDEGRWAVGELTTPHTAAVDLSTLPFRADEPTATTPGTLSIPAGVSRGHDFGFHWTTLLGGSTREDPTSTTSAPSRTSTTSDQSPTSTTADPSSTTTTSTTEPPGRLEETCLPGTWLLDSQAFLDEIVRISAERGAPFPGAITYVDGEYTLEIAEDGATTMVRDDWTFSLSTDQGTIFVIMNGTQQGTVTYDTTRIQYTEMSSTVQVQLEIEFNGARQVLPGGEQPIETEVLGGAGTYECDGDTLTIVTVDDVLGSTWTRTD